jgi:ribosomal protein L34E
MLSSYKSRSTEVIIKKRKSNRLVSTNRKKDRATKSIARTHGQYEIHKQAFDHWF